MDEKCPLISVIMPFYNTAPAFMVEAIESVMTQTYPHWELLLVDDGSTEVASSQTAQAYAEAHPNKIRYLEHPSRANKGSGLSRQLALTQAQGELVALLDADDLWLPTKLTEQVELLTKHPEVGAIYGRTQYWHSWRSSTNEVAKDHTPSLGLAANTIIPPPELLILFVQQQIAIPCTCSLVVRRDELNSGFESGIKGFFYDDQMLYAKICLRAPVYVADVCWDYYRQHPDSGTHRTSEQGQALHLEYLYWLADYLQQQQVENETLWQVLNRQVWLHQQPSWLPRQLHRPTRLGKKWLLRLEAKLPTSIQHQFWQGS